MKRANVWFGTIWARDIRTVSNAYQGRYNTYVMNVFSAKCTSSEPVNITSASDLSLADLVPFLGEKKLLTKIILIFQKPMPIFYFFDRH